MWFLGELWFLVVWFVLVWRLVKQWQSVWIQLQQWLLSEWNVMLFLHRCHIYGNQQ